MKTIIYAEVQQLVTKIPKTELPLAYCLLAELVAGETQSPQAAFMRLSVDERRQILAQQAEQMKTHYEETADERIEWQTGDFISD
ncbi:hypothetical protein C6499_22310 [Candidatus Poribacteria bacterium]|nr:MAG: hypothetical protein C6499_22310 [Candidatus Poribacteria bacterium]